MALAPAAADVSASAPSEQVGLPLLLLPMDLQLPVRPELAPERREVVC
jgi:hypothetical protein